AWSGRHARARRRVRGHGRRRSVRSGLACPCAAAQQRGRRMTKVLLVDDHALVRVGFRLVLESAGDLEVVGEASDGRAAFDQVTALRPDVVLMDVRMPGVNGIDATRRIVEAYPEVRILILTTFDLDEYAF